MLRLSSSAQDSLLDVLDMLEELSLTLPRFKAYEKTLPLDGALETASLDVYTEVVCFTHDRYISFDHIRMSCCVEVLVKSFEPTSATQFDASKNCPR